MSLRAKTLAIRAALRVEGNDWVAYCAAIGTMEGATEFARVKMSVVTRSPELKAQFIAFATAVVGAMILEATGQRAEWNEPIGAPEHERSGRG